MYLYCLLSDETIHFWFSCADKRCYGQLLCRLASIWKVIQCTGSSSSYYYPTLKRILDFVFVSLIIFCLTKRGRAMSPPFYLFLKEEAIMLICNITYSHIHCKTDDLPCTIIFCKGFIVTTFVRMMFQTHGPESLVNLFIWWTVCHKQRPHHTPQLHSNRDSVDRVKVGTSLTQDQINSHWTPMLDPIDYESSFFSHRINIHNINTNRK